MLRPRFLLAACALALVAFHAPIADAVTAPDAHHIVPVAVSGPSRASSDAQLTNALRANLAYQATKDADLAAWYAAASRPAPTHYVKQSGATAIPSEPVAYDPGSIEATICAVFGPYCAKAIHVAQCESGLNPSATNPSGAKGLFQLLGHGDMFEAHGWSASDWPDPYKNSVVAFDLSKGGTSWGAWRCS